jgi:hypothetical protein
MKLLPRHAVVTDNNFMITGAGRDGVGRGLGVGASAVRPLLLVIAPPRGAARDYSAAISVPDRVRLSHTGDDPAITGEPPEEQPGNRPSRTGRDGPSQPANERAVAP